MTLEEYLENLGLLGEYHKDRFHKAFTEALEDFNKHYAKTMRFFNKREKANVMHAHLRHRIKTIFRGVSGVYFDERPNRAFKIILDGRPVGINAIGFVKLKKSSKYLKTSNILTKTVENFMTQQLDNLTFTPVIQHSLFGNTEESGLKTDRIVNLPDFVNLMACYCPNKTWSDFDRLAVTFPVSIKNVKLVSDFTEIVSESVAEVVDIQPRTSVKPQKKQRVRQRQNKMKPTRKQLRKFVESQGTEKENFTKDKIKKKA